MRRFLLGHAFETLNDSRLPSVVKGGHATWVLLILVIVVVFLLAIAVVEDCTEKGGVGRGQTVPRSDLLTSAVACIFGHPRRAVGPIAQFDLDKERR
jgi:hypothetical protein